MITDLALRWVVTVLFALAIAEFLYSLVTHRMRWSGVLSHVLHLIMSVAMLVMAWPFSMEWPTTGPMVFFVVAGVWFLIAAIAFAGGPAEQVAHLYHAVMMGAMAWMYAAMNGTLLPGSDDEITPADGMHGADSSMPGMDMPHGGMYGTGVHTARPGYVTPVDLILGAVFVLAALVWLYLYVSRRRLAGDREDRASALLTHSGELSQVFMATGMAIMFFVMA